MIEWMSVDVFKLLIDKDMKMINLFKGMVDCVVDFVERSCVLYFEIFLCLFFNVCYNKFKCFIEMGFGKNKCELFNFV